MKPLHSLIFILIISFSSCTKDYYYEQSISINDATWSYSEPVKFEVDIDDPKKKYNLYFDIEHSTDFSFQNMYVQIHTTFPKAEKTSVPLSIDFMDDTGRWFGKCNSEQCKLRVQLKTAIMFKDPGKYTFEFEQYMRTEKLVGIHNLAFRMEEVGL